MEEREEREEKASLLTEQEAIIKWQHIQTFHLVGLDFKGCGAYIGQENQGWLFYSYKTQQNISPVSITP